jgi:hypothetical protein
MTPAAVACRGWVRSAKRHTAKRGRDGRATAIMLVVHDLFLSQRAIDMQGVSPIYVEWDALK